MSEDRYTELAHAGLPVEGFVVDSHAHLGEEPNFPIPRYCDLDLFVADMDRHGVDVSCPSCIPIVLGGLQPGGNELVLEAVRRYTDRFFGWMGINPNYPEEMRCEMDRCYEAGCRGLKIHESVGLPYDHDNYRIALHFAAEHGMPVLAHTWGEMAQIEPYFKDYPKINWSLAHSGSARPEEYVRVGREYENVYLDICYSRSPRGIVEFFVREGVTEKVMFGSDCYFMGLSQQIGRVLFADISAEQKRLILGENARRFLGDACPSGARGGS